MINANGSNSHRKVPRIARNSNKIAKGTSTKNKRSRAFKREFPFSVEVYENSVHFHLPMRTVSEANNFDHYRIKHKRHTLQRQIVAAALKPHKDKIKLPCSIKLIRYAPGTLDKFENLPMSFKYIVDACCAIITGDFRAGRADGDERISLSCDQVKSVGYGIKILITF